MHKIIFCTPEKKTIHPTFLEIILNTTIEKKFNSDLIRICSTDIAQYRSIQKFLSDYKIDFFAVQPRKERPKKILLKGIPKYFSIL